MAIQVDRENGMIRTDARLRSSGGSTVLTIPSGVLDQFDGEAGEAVDVAVTLDGDRVTIEPKGEE